MSRGGTNPFMFASGRASSVKNLQKQTCGVAWVGYFLWIRAARCSWLFNWLILCYISAINAPVHHSYNQQHFNISATLKLPSASLLVSYWMSTIFCPTWCSWSAAAAATSPSAGWIWAQSGLLGRGVLLFFFLLALGLYSLCFPNQTSVETFSSSWLDTQQESSVVFFNNRRCYIGAFSFLITEKIWKDKSPSSLVCLLFLQVSAMHLVLDALHLLSLTNLIRKYCAWVVQSI